MTLEDKEQLVKYLPKKFSTQLTDEVVALVDGMGHDMGMETSSVIDSLLDNMVNVKDLKGLTLAKYFNALKFITVKANGSTASDAWRTTFKDKALEYPNAAIAKYASAYSRSKLVTTLEAKMLVAFSIQYSHFRHQALNKVLDLANGKAAPSIEQVYHKDSYGKFVLDDYHNKIPLRDHNGDLMVIEHTMTVTPLVQLQAAQEVLKITTPKEENDITVNIGITDEAMEATMKVADGFSEIARLQREAYAAGGDINKIQQIGNTIETFVVKGEGFDDE